MSRQTKSDQKVAISNYIQALGRCIGASNKDECDGRSKIVSRIDKDLFCEWSTTRRSTEEKREKLEKEAGKIKLIREGSFVKDTTNFLEGIVDAIEVEFPVSCKLSIKGPA